LTVPTLHPGPRRLAQHAREARAKEKTPMLRPFAPVDVRLLAGALSLVGVLAGSHEGVGQTAPSRIANIWDYRDHQPTRGSVRSAEQASGIAPSASEKARVDEELQRLYEQLLGDERSPAASHDRP
jgi:hypothetical protein